MKNFPFYSEPPFISIVLFELNSWLGRSFFKNSSKFPIGIDPYLIDIGVGSNYKKGWVDVDFFRNRFRKPWEKRLSRSKPNVETDFRFALNCANNTADGIYSGHTIEHLYPNHAYDLLKEMYRILKPGCWIRIVVPNLKRAVDFYNGEVEILDYKYKAEAIAHLTQNWGHHSVWDSEILSKVIESIGFISIKEVEFGTEGKDARLIVEEDDRKQESLVIEAYKPY